MTRIPELVIPSFLTRPLGTRMSTIQILVASFVVLFIIKTAVDFWDGMKAIQCVIISCVYCYH